jgi:glycosyltransferase involved in cell wall biosynthesis
MSSVYRAVRHLTCRPTATSSQTVCTWSTTASIILIKGRIRPAPCAPCSQPAWYKNTAGVIRLYAHYARQTAQPLPLWMISPAPSTPDVQAALLTVPPHAQVHFKQGIDNATLQAVYSVAKAFLFPSLAEGFGWPIIESQVCGCLLLTTDDTPMSEIAGPAATLLPRLHRGDDIDQWAQSAAAQLMAVLNMDEARRLALQHQAMAWASTFTEQRALDAYQAIYQQLMPASVLTVSSVPTP